MKQREHYDLMIKAITVAVAVVMGIVVVFICQMYRSEPLDGDSDVNTKLSEFETTMKVMDEATKQETARPETTEEQSQTTEITTIETTTIETTTTEITSSQETTTKKKTQPTKQTTTEKSTKYANADISSWINANGTTVGTRIKTPDGFERLTYEDDSYAFYVQSLPLKAYGTKMYEYNGKLVENQSWCASVIVTEFHDRGWLQCADCVMKLVGDYLYEHGRYSDIVFENASGNILKYTSWTDGDYSKKMYEKYMSEVYYSANTSSFKAQKESVRLDIDDIFPGAYFIMDKDSKHEYGHAVFVIDVAKNPDNGEVAFLLAQGSTPSQDMHIFLNPLHPNDPWYYSSEIGAKFAIPFWQFDSGNLYYYKPIGIQYGEIETVQEPEQTEASGGGAHDDETTTVESTEATSTEEMESTTVEDSTEDSSKDGSELATSEETGETTPSEEISDETLESTSEERTTSMDETTDTTESVSVDIEETEK